MSRFSESPPDESPLRHFTGRGSPSGLASGRRGSVQQPIGRSNPHEGIRTYSHGHHDSPRRIYQEKGELNPSYREDQSWAGGSPEVSHTRRHPHGGHAHLSYRRANDAGSDHGSVARTYRHAHAHGDSIGDQRSDRDARYAAAFVDGRHRQSSLPDRSSDYAPHQVPLSPSGHFGHRDYSQSHAYSPQMRQHHHQNHRPSSSMNPLAHPLAHVSYTPNQVPSQPMSLPHAPSQIFGPAAGLQPVPGGMPMGPPLGQPYPNAMQSVVPTQPADYTQFSAMTGNQLETMPFASPHFPGPGGVGYPNAMPLCRSVEVLPGPGSYGHPRHPTYCKPDYRRFCFSVGKADVPYAAVGQAAPPLGSGGPWA